MTCRATADGWNDARKGRRPNQHTRNQDLHRRPKHGYTISPEKLYDSILTNRLPVKPLFSQTGYSSSGLPWGFDSLPGQLTFTGTASVGDCRPACRKGKLTREERATTAKVEISAHFNAKQQAFLDFVLAHYVSEGVQELDQDKLTPLLRLRYNNSIADAIADLGRPEEIGKAFADFQQYLYQSAA